VAIWAASELSEGPFPVPLQGGGDVYAPPGMIGTPVVNLALDGLGLVLVSLGRWFSSIWEGPSSSSCA